MLCVSCMNPTHVTIKVKPQKRNEKIGRTYDTNRRIYEKQFGEEAATPGTLLLEGEGGGGEGAGEDGQREAEVDVVDDYDEEKEAADPDFLKMHK